MLTKKELSMIELAPTLEQPKAMTKAEQIRKYVAAHPNATPTQIAEAMGVNRQYIYTVMYKAKAKAKVKKHRKVAKKLGRPRKVTEASENLKKLVDEYKQAKAVKKDDWKKISLTNPNTPIQKADPVNHPAHYKVGGIETIDFIEAKKLGYNLGNVVKYITRSDHKGNRLQDLRKAQWYLEREIWNAEDNKKTA
jgi:DNA-binding CsgD family transcriptional regulator